MVQVAGFPQTEKQFVFGNIQVAAAVLIIGVYYLENFDTYQYSVYHFIKELILHFFSHACKVKEKNELYIIYIYRNCFEFPSTPPPLPSPAAGSGG
jgi:hypothetical protein